MVADAPFDQALPWLLLAAAIAVLIAAAVGLVLDRRELSRAEADLQSAEAEIQRLEAANAAIASDVRRLSAALARTRGERDTLRELLDSRTRHPGRAQTPPGDEFTEVVQRNTWPQWPT